MGIILVYKASVHKVAYGCKSRLHVDIHWYKEVHWVSKATQIGYTRLHMITLDYTGLHMAMELDRVTKGRLCTKLY